jgi:WD40 repeat protein
LSRIIGTKKKDSPSEAAENASEPDDNINGVDDIFAHPIGFIPRFPPPPRYIKVKAHYKKTKTFDRLFLAQELRGSEAATDEKLRSKSTDHKAVWALEFSKDGKYLAVAGQDKVVRVWAVITNSEDREAHELEEDYQTKGGHQGLRLTAPVFKSKPVQEYEGHSGSILDLSWSKVSFCIPRRIWPYH